MTKSGMSKGDARDFRVAKARDIPELARLYATTIRAHGPDKYSPLQVDAWASFAAKEERFAPFILDVETWILEDARGPAGFGGMGADGHIASLYVRADCARQGVGRMLVMKLLDRARERSLSRVYTEASQFSKALFERLGFRVVEEEIADYDGVTFLRWKMDRLVGGDGQHFR